MRKVGIVGAGAVGAACAMALALRHSADEIVLVNRTPARSVGIATDITYGAAMGDVTAVRSADTSDLAGCSIVLLTAGVNEMTGGATDRNDKEGRLKLLTANAKIYRELVPDIVAAAPSAVIIVVTDPPDPLTDVARASAGHERVFGTGTFLDSLRFRTHLGRHLLFRRGRCPATANTALRASFSGPRLELPVVRSRHLSIDPKQRVD